jgi:HTH-type transcriptional regulator / antitoxin HigA
MNVNPIKTEADNDAALRRIEELWNAEPGTPEDDELGILVTLVHAYEEEHYPFGEPDPIASIEFNLERKGWTPKDLVGIIGSRTRVYEVLRGDRALTLRMIRNLHRELGISYEVLCQPTGKAAKGKRRPAATLPGKTKRRALRRSA